MRLKVSGGVLRRSGVLSGYLRDDRGQSATEYILIIGLIVVPLAIAFNELQDVLKATLNRIAKLFSAPGV